MQLNKLAMFSVGFYLCFISPALGTTVTFDEDELGVKLPGFMSSSSTQVMFGATAGYDLFVPGSLGSWGLNNLEVVENQGGTDDGNKSLRLNVTEMTNFLVMNFNHPLTSIEFDFLDSVPDFGPNFGTTYANILVYAGVFDPNVNNWWDAAINNKIPYDLRFGVYSFPLNNSGRFKTFSYTGEAFRSAMLILTDSDCFMSLGDITVDNITFESAYDSPPDTPPQTPVPEPCTFLLVGAGIAGIGTWRKMKSESAK